jgi:hypothetical protein
MAPKLFHRATAIVLALMALAPAAVGAQEIKVTLLGTGTPVPAMNRFGPSILVEARGQEFLFDAGRGALQRLGQLKVRWQDIDGVFLEVASPESFSTGGNASRARQVGDRASCDSGTSRRGVCQDGAKALGVFAHCAARRDGARSDTADAKDVRGAGGGRRGSHGHSAGREHRRPPPCAPVAVAGLADGELANLSMGA